jgi:hypothetical protein
MKEQVKERKEKRSDVLSSNHILAQWGSIILLDILMGLMMRLFLSYCGWSERGIRAAGMFLVTTNDVENSLRSLGGAG